MKWRNSEIRVVYIVFYNVGINIHSTHYIIVCREASLHSRLPHKLLIY